MARTASQCGLVAVILALLLLCACCQEPAEVALQGDGAQVVWKDAGGGPVVSLKRNGSVVELDSTLRAEEVHANQMHIDQVHTQEVYIRNASYSDTYEMYVNLSHYADALDVANANLSAEIVSLRAALAEAQGTADVDGFATTWNLNNNWFDLATTVDSGLAGYIDGFVAGDFAYYAPYKDDTAHHGRVVRVNMSDFSSSGVEWFDLETSVNAGLVGFVGGFTAGDFAYYVPYSNGTQHGRVVRINMSNFTSGGVEWFDLATTVHTSLRGFHGGFASGEFAYYVPYYHSSSYHGRVVRINMTNFTSGGVEWFDLETEVDSDLIGFHGGFSDDEFAYYVPFYDGDVHGRVVRINTSNFSSGGVEWFELETEVHSDLKGFIGGFATGGFAYYVPHDNGNKSGMVVRIDTADFTATGVQWFDVASTVNPGLVGFQGGFVAGEFAYYVPYHDGTSEHGRVVRIDMSDFSPSGVEWYDLTTTVNEGLKGFFGGFVSGEFVYLVPFYDGSFHGRIVRIKK